LHATYVTARHVMQWAICKALLRAVVKGEKPEFADLFCKEAGVAAWTAEAVVSRMHQIADAETENVVNALRFHEEDSRIGFEPTMEYIFSPDHAAWKNRETQRSLRRIDAFMAAQGK
jgi:hypothetical protein